MRDVIHAWLLVAHTYVTALRRLTQAASTGEREGEASLAGAARGSNRSHTERPADPTCVCGHRRYQHVIGSGCWKGGCTCPSFHDREA